MRPNLHPSLVNGRSGDPALYIEMLFDKRAILFDLGDISLLSIRKILRLEQVFVSHAHIDHFVGFDRLLRLHIGRNRTIRLYGPAGFAQHVHHKLHAYRWDLVDRIAEDLVFVVTEIDSSMNMDTVRFRLKDAFAGETVGSGRILDMALCIEPNFRVSTVMLEHRTPCLAFAVEETAHVNVWKNRLMELGLSVGPWLRELKRAVVELRPDDHPVMLDSGHIMRLGELRPSVTITAGQKIGYVTDVADTPENRNKITRLVRNAEMLFIEAPFAQADAALAADRAHLTTAAAGAIAREANVRRIEPFHFSPRYTGQEARLLKEVQEAFQGQDAQ
jgi:ribonuclease Z